MLSLSINTARHLARLALAKFGRTEALRYFKQAVGAPGEHAPVVGLDLGKFGRRMRSINDLFSSSENYNCPLNNFDRRINDYSSSDWYAGYDTFLLTTYKGSIEAYFVAALAVEMAKTDPILTQQLSYLRNETYKNAAMIVA